MHFVPALSIVALLAGAVPCGYGIEIVSNVQNANHIFNAIHSSMRQWGSSWNHNGMSFFLATVPAGTQFYHGTFHNERVNGTEWLAFEPQHALYFANPPHQRPRLPGHGKPRSDGQEQYLLGAIEKEGRGYLHTYSATKDLRLLYIDGLSAAKTDMGTLDSQDRILFDDRIPYPKDSINQFADEPRPSVPPDETERAQIGCEMAKNEWNDRIDGFLRAEAGFEIILCDFMRDVHLEYINAVSPNNYSEPTDLFYYKSIAARFNGIGGERVKVNYDHFVTAYAYDDIDVFDGKPSELPRLTHLPSDKLADIRQDVTNLILEHEVNQSSFNWQSIADMIVTRYSDWIQYLASDKINSLQDLKTEISKTFIPFIDSLHRNATLEIERCSLQFIPRGKRSLIGTNLAANAIHDVSFSICSTLRTAMDDTDFTTAVSRLKKSIGYLSWTTWKECPQKCGYNEECYIPIWPFGTVQDRLSPQCKSKQDGEGETYWSGFGRFPPRLSSADPKW